MSKRERCASVVEYEPEPCAGSLDVRCERPDGHKGEHRGSVLWNSWRPQYQIEMEAEVHGTLRWTTRKRKPEPVSRGRGMSIREADQLLREIWEPAIRKAFSGGGR